ncbi:SRPBCC domain-containing protein [Streptomyces triticirhizae]|nr:SRPBCC domain-containing protein [Streptomyces triticirhizae]
MEHEVYLPYAPAVVLSAFAEPRRVARCVPGLQPAQPGTPADRDAGPDALRGRLRLRVGSSSITYRGSLALAPTEGAGCQVRVEGEEARGSGTVNLLLTVTPRPVDGGAACALAIDGRLTATGRLAELTDEQRESTGRRLLDRFAAALADELSQEATPMPPSGGIGEPDDNERAIPGIPTASPTPPTPPGGGSASGAAGVPRGRSAEEPTGPTASGGGASGGSAAGGGAQDGEDWSGGVGDGAGGGGSTSGGGESGSVGSASGEGVSDDGAVNGGGSSGSSGAASEGDGAVSQGAGSASGGSVNGAGAAAGAASDGSAGDRDAVGEEDDAGGATSRDEKAGPGDASGSGPAGQAPVEPAASEPAAEPGSVGGRAAGRGEATPSALNPERSEPSSLPAPEADHARRTMIGRSAEEVDHAPPRGRYAPEPAPEEGGRSGALLRWAAPAAALAVASAVALRRVLRRR